MAAQKFTVEQVIDAIGKGFTPTGAGAVLHCNPDTIRNYAERYPSVKKALLAARQDIVGHAELGLRAAVLRGEPWAITFALKTLGKDDGYTERQEVTGANGGPVANTTAVMIDYAKLSDEQIATLLAILRAARTGVDEGSGAAASA